METQQIIYLVAFALILRIFFRMVMRFRKEKSDESEINNIEKFQ